MRLLQQSLRLANQGPPKTNLLLYAKAAVDTIGLSTDDYGSLTAAQQAFFFTNPSTPVTWSTFTEFADALSAESWFDNESNVLLNTGKGCAIYADGTASATLTKAQQFLRVLPGTYYHGVNLAGNYQTWTGLPAADYYVDSVNGNDGNDGLMVDTALATIGALPSLSGGDVIGLAAGSHWREELIIAGTDNVTVFGYGTGNRPVLDGSDVVGGWAKTAGQTNVYESSITLAQTTTIFTNVFEDTTLLTRASSVSNCDLTPGSYYLSEASTTTTLYIHPTGSTDATTDGKTREVTVRNTALKAESSSGTIVRNIKTKKNLNHNGSLWVGQNSVVNNCIAEWGNKHNMFVRGGSTVTDSEATEAYFGGSPVIMMLYYQAAAAGESVIFSGCKSTSAESTLSGSGIGGHSSSGNFGTISVSNCAVSGMDIGGGFNCANAAYVGIESSTVTDSHTGITAPSTANTNIDNCTINVDTIGVSANGTTNISNSHITVNISAASAIRSLVDNVTLSVTDSTFNDSSGWVFQLTGYGLDFTSTGNVFEEGGFGWYDITRADAVISSDNNIFQESSLNFRKEGVTYSATEWQGLGYDINSTFP